MAAPTPTARVEPTGARIPRGYRVLVTLTADPNISLWEISLTPPGEDQGDMIDITTQWNDDVRTKAFRALTEITDGSGTFGYAPESEPLIRAAIGDDSGITFHFPNGSSWAYWGGLRSFEPDEMSDEDAPSATCSFGITNWDPENLVEAGPVYTAPSPPPP